MTDSNCCDRSKSQLYTVSQKTGPLLHFQITPTILFQTDFIFVFYNKYASTCYRFRDITAYWSTSVNAWPTPLSFNVSFLKTRPNIRTNLISPETRVHAGDLRRRKYVSIFISFHAIIFRTRVRQPSKPARKQNLTPNSPSRSFKVIYFGVTGKGTGD